MRTPRGLRPWSSWRPRSWEVQRSDFFLSHISSFSELLLSLILFSYYLLNFFTIFNLNLFKLLSLIFFFSLMWSLFFKLWRLLALARESQGSQEPLQVACAATTTTTPTIYPHHSSCCSKLKQLKLTASMSFNACTSNLRNPCCFPGVTCPNRARHCCNWHHNWQFEAATWWQSLLLLSTSERKALCKEWVSLKTFCNSD